MPLREGSAQAEGGIDEESRREPDSAFDPAESPWMGRRALLVSLGFWTLFGALTASNWLLSPLGQNYPYPGRIVAKAFYQAYVWALLTPAIFRLAPRFSPESGARLRRGLVLLGMGLITGAVVTGVDVAGTALIFPRTGPGSEPSGWVLARFYFPTAVVTFFVVLVAGLMSDISRRYRARQREANQLRAERAELQAQAARLQAQSAELHAQLAEARLAMLRTRFNPHFLFNTLNAVSALVSTDARGVRQMISLLSELLRYALRDSGEQEIPIEEEMRLLHLYLRILEIRYQGQLQSGVTVEPEAKGALVPNLILQPLVENSVKHGIDRAGGHGTIAVGAARSGEDLILTVRDTGPGADQEMGENGREGVGLRMTRERLAELYGSETRLELRPAPGGGMVAQVVLPFHTREDVRLAEEPSPG
jgi:signal transduction histidine kinase